MRLPVAFLAAVALTVLSLLSPSAPSAATCNVPNTYATIQAAIAVPGCTVINVAAGTYDGPITIARDLSLRGVGDVSVIRAPAGPLADPKAIIRVTGPATNATVERFKITGPGSGDCNSLLAGIYVDDNATATIRNNHFVAIRDEPLGGCVEAGVAILVGRTPTTHGHAVVSKNRIEDYQRAGIVVENTGSSATILDNVVVGSGLRCCGLAAQNGIQVSDAANIKVMKNTVVDNRYDPAVGASGGILFTAPGNTLSVTGNTVQRNDVGIWLQNTSNAVVTTNKVTDSTWDGIALDGVQGPGPVTLNTLTRNQLKGNADGIGLYDADNNILESNTSTDSFGPGFFVDSASEGNTFTKNRANKNTAGAGIEDQSTGGGSFGTANTYSGNVCGGNSGGDSIPTGICK